MVLPPPPKSRWFPGEKSVKRGRRRRSSSPQNKSNQFMFCQDPHSYTNVGGFRCMWLQTLLQSSMWCEVSVNTGKWANISSHRANHQSNFLTVHQSEQQRIYFAKYFPRDETAAVLQAILSTWLVYHHLLVTPAYLACLFFQIFSMQYSVYFLPVHFAFW